MMTALNVLLGTVSSALIVLFGLHLALLRRVSLERDVNLRQWTAQTEFNDLVLASFRHAWDHDVPSALSDAMLKAREQEKDK